MKEDIAVHTHGIDHTPTPWQVEDHFIIGADHDPICDLDYWHTPHDKANAAFVVKAVNAHKLLIEALIWCSGSPSFQIDGEARKGWEKLCQPLIDEAIK